VYDLAVGSRSKAALAPGSQIGERVAGWRSGYEEVLLHHRLTVESLVSIQSVHTYGHTSTRPAMGLLVMVFYQSGHAFCYMIDVSGSQAVHQVICRSGY
jgi:hypothetical protein